MALVQTCKCEECGAQKSFANHWVMLLERNGSLIVMPAWDEKKLRRTLHFCGRAHASRYVERWIANPGMALAVESAAEMDSEDSSERLAEPASAITTGEEYADAFGDEASSARIVPNRPRDPELCIPRTTQTSTHPPRRNLPAAASFSARGSVPLPAALVLHTPYR